MPYKIRTRQCQLCGERITGRYPPSKPVNCINCSIKIMQVNALAMAKHKGNGYDKWLASAGPKGRPRKQVRRR